MENNVTMSGITGTTLMLLIGGGLALVFIVSLAVDSYRRRNRRYRGRGADMNFVSRWFVGVRDSVRVMRESAYRQQRAKVARERTAVDRQPEDPRDY
jgi:hypothetical protein